MDPEAVWSRLLAALEAGEHNEVADAATSLRTWLKRGGFPPQIVPGRVLPIEWQRAVVLSACQAALQHAGSMQEES